MQICGHSDPGIFSRGRMRPLQLPPLPPWGDRKVSFRHHTWVTNPPVRCSHMHYDQFNRPADITIFRHQKGVARRKIDIGAGAYLKMHQTGQEESEKDICPPCLFNMRRVVFATTEHGGFNYQLRLLVIGGGIPPWRATIAYQPPRGGVPRTPSLSLSSRASMASEESEHVFPS